MFIQNRCTELFNLLKVHGTISIAYFYVDKTYVEINLAHGIYGQQNIYDFYSGKKRC